MNLPKRKNTRLKNYDYSSEGAYFITICSHNKKCIFSSIVGGGALDAPQNKLSNIGKIVEKYIISTNNIQGVKIDKYIIMPNHIHLILTVQNGGGTSKAPSPTNNIISHAVSTFKRFVNNEVGSNVFQRSFHDHVIRGKSDYQKIWQYIDSNAQKWEQDCFYVE